MVDLTRTGQRDLIPDRDFERAHMLGGGSTTGEDDVSTFWRFERQLTESHAVLWGVIIVASVFDIVTTITGLSHGLEEGNAVARAFMETYGTPGLGMLKFSALFVLLFAWAALPDREAEIVLTGFAVVSLLTVVLNALTLAPL
jgi:hypothetical protein